MNVLAESAVEPF